MSSLECPKCTSDSRGSLAGQARARQANQGCGNSQADRIRSECVERRTLNVSCTFGGAQLPVTAVTQ